MKIQKNRIIGFIALSSLWIFGAQAVHACSGGLIFACKTPEPAQMIFDLSINPVKQNKDRQSLIKSEECKDICRDNLQISGNQGLFVIYQDNTGSKWFVR